MADLNFYFRTACLIAVFSFMAAFSHAQIPAFPGAEGFGASTPGGRGGQVIKVTNTNDDGPGSFREACETSGPRIVVFTVGGTITLRSTIKVTEPYLTIAGQTAPGGGICLRSNENGKTTLTLKTHDIIIRHIRIRPGPGGESDGLAIQTEDAHDIIIDHCSITWGVDESSSFYTGDVTEKIKNVTYQWCIISDALDCSTHEEGCHSKGLLLQYCDKISVHHNLFANNGGRSPMILSGEMDVVNNVVYNWGGSVVKIENRHGDVFLNYVKNYLVPGADSDMSENGIQVKTSGIHIYLEDNIAEHVRPDHSYAEDAIVNYREPATLVSSRYNYPAVTTVSAAQAYQDVLDFSGARLPAIDIADQNTVAGVRNRTGRIIDHPDDVGGYPNLATGTAPTDTDSDGMPDSWETENGLNPNDSSDANGDDDGDGYTNIEAYINSLTNTPVPINDCNGDLGGSAYIDACGDCVGGNTGLNPCDLVTDVRIDNCPSTILSVGSNLNLNETVSPPDASDKGVSWSSSNTSVATVNRSGTVTALSAGTAVITVTTDQGHKTDDCTINVQDNGTGNAITLQAEDAILGGQMEVTDVHTGYIGSGFVNFPKKDGYVQFTDVDGGSGGNATLTLRWALGKPDRDGLLIVNGTSRPLTMETTGAWTRWTSKNLPVDLNAGSTNTIRFESVGNDFGNLDEIVIETSTSTINDCNGDLGGSAYIDNCGDCVGGNTGLDPCDLVTGVRIDNCPSTILSVGNNLNLNETVSPSDASDKGVSWSSSNTSVATVNSSGTVTALSTGTAVINVTTDQGQKTDDCTINVQDNGTGNTITLQAEDAILGGQMEVTDVHAGYMGSGFVNFPKKDGYVQFTDVDGGSGGNATLTLRLALGKPDRDGLLIVNGTSRPLTMETTGAWTRWTSKSLPIDLNAGSTNTIRFESTGNDFGNLDEITLETYP